MNTLSGISRVPAIRLDRPWRLLCGLVAAGGVIVPLLLVAGYSWNSPWNYDDVAVCLGQFPLQGGDGDLVRYFLTFKNDHPQTIQRLFSLLSYGCLGSVNFTFINLASLLSVILFGVWAGARERAPSFFCVTLCLLCGFNRNIFLWASASAVYSFPYMFLVMGAVLARAPSWPRFPALCFLCLACVFSFGNGIALVPALLLTSGVWIWSDPDTRPREFLPVGLALLISTLAYVDLMPSATDIGTFLRHFLDDPAVAITFFLEMNGLFAKYLPGPWSPNAAASGFGALLVTLPLWGFYRARKDRDMFPYFTLWWFSLGSAAATTLGRAYTSSWRTDIAPRYEFNSVFLFFAVWGLLWRSTGKALPPLRTTFGLLVLSLVGLKTFENSRYLDAHHNAIRELPDYILSGLPHRLDVGDYRETTSGQVRNAYWFHHEVEEAQRRGIYHPPRHLKDSAWIFNQSADSDALEWMSRFHGHLRDDLGPYRYGWIKRLVPGILEWRFTAPDASPALPPFRVTWFPAPDNPDATIKEATSGTATLFNRQFNQARRLPRDPDCALLTATAQHTWLVLAPDVGAALVEVRDAAPEDSTPEKIAEALWRAAPDTRPAEPQ